MSQSSGPTCRKAAVRFGNLYDAHQIPDEWITQCRGLGGRPEAVRNCIEATLCDAGLLYGLYTPVFSGFLWVELQPLENALYVNAYSVDKSCWHTKEHLKCLIKLLEWLKSILKVDKVRWFTDRPALYRRLGYQPSKTIMMEA